MLPFNRLHPFIKRAVDKTLINGGYLDGPLDHYIVTVRGDKNWMYFMEPRRASSSFLFEIDLKTEQDRAKVTIGDVGGQYAEKPTDRDKTKRTLDRNKVIFRGYLDASLGGRNVLSDPEVIFHPSQAPKPLPKVEMNERERRIMYCFGYLKNNGFRREALSRLDVQDKEILTLIAKGCLKMTGAGPIMTVIGEVNKLRPHGRAPEDQW